MNGLPYYKAYPRDFIEGTVGMPFEMKAAYRLIIDFIYMQNGRLPDDARYIAGLLGCSVKKWNAIRKWLLDAGKIDARDGYLGNYRADKELETLGKFQDQQRQNASGPRKNNDLEKPTLSHTDTEPDTGKKEPPTEVPQPTDLYAFQAQNIRLTGKHLEQWRQAFPHITLESELMALDEWAGDQGGKWFFAVQSALAKKERAARERINIRKTEMEAGPARRAVGDGRI